MNIAFIECKSRTTAKRRCPWATAVIKVDGGFMCFRFFEDLRGWQRHQECLDRIGRV